VPRTHASSRPRRACRRTPTHLSFSVLGGDDVARSLYRSLGWTERAVFMAKEL
jgi:hypothetical protein